MAESWRERPTGNSAISDFVDPGMNITVIGRGNVGGSLARRWEKAGHEVTELGREGGDASGADAVLVAVPSNAIADALRQGERNRGQGLDRRDECVHRPQRG